MTEPVPRHRRARSIKMTPDDCLSGPIDRLRRSPGVPGGIGREPRELSEPGVSHHPRGARLDGLGRSIQLQEALRRPIERPSPLLVPAVTTRTNAKGGDRLVVPTEASQGIAQIVEPARVVRVLG